VLAALLAEWLSERAYTVRIANLRGDGSGEDFEARLNGSHFLTMNTTVFDDEAGNTLTGGDGLDWFFAAVVSNKDLLMDQQMDLELVEDFSL